MALGMATTVRNNRLNALRDYIDGGTGAALLRIYNGSRPATGGTATTLLAQLTLGDPSASNASSAVLTFNSITQDSSNDATGTASWWRLVQSDGTTHIMDGDYGTSGSDINGNSTSFVAGGTASMTSWTITEGNP